MDRPSPYVIRPMVGLTSLFIYVYAAIAPVLTVKELGLQASEYGTLSLIPFIVYTLGNLMTTAMNRAEMPMKKSIAIAFGCILVLCVAFLADVLLNDLNIWIFYVLICLIFYQNLA